MESLMRKLSEKVGKSFLPLYASVKNICINGFVCTSLYHNADLQLIIINNTVLKPRFFYYTLNVFFFKELSHENKIKLILGPNKYFIYILNIDCPPEYGNIFLNNEAHVNTTKENFQMIDCLSLLVKNCFAISNCLADLNLPESRKRHSNQTANLTFLGNVIDDSTKPTLINASLFQRSNHCQKQPLQIKNLTYCITRAIKKSFKKWLYYKNLASFVQASRNYLEISNFPSSCQQLCPSSFDYNIDDHQHIENIKAMKLYLSRKLKDRNPHESSPVELLLCNAYHQDSSSSYKESINQGSLPFEWLSTLFPGLNCNTGFSTSMKLGPYLNFPTCQMNLAEKNIYHLSGAESQKVDTIGKGPLDLIQRIDIDPNVCFKNPLFLEKKRLSKDGFITSERNIYVPKGSSPMMVIHKSCIPPNEALSKQEIELKKAKDKKNLSEVENSLTLDQGCSKGKFSSKQIVKTVDKSFFNKINVIGQVDRKYILCYYLDEEEGTQVQHLIVLDQHAVDERINLEKLLARFSDSTEENSLRTHSINDQLIVIEFKKEDMNEVFTCIPYFLKYGLHLVQDTSQSFSVIAIPEFLHWLAIKKKKDGVDYSDFIKRTIYAMLEEQVSSIKENGNLTNVMPSELYRYFCREACLSAVNFGVALPYYSCEKLVKNIVGCTLPFMCAHGRPVVCFLGEIPLSPALELPATISLFRSNKKIKLS